MNLNGRLLWGESHGEEKGQGKMVGNEQDQFVLYTHIFHFVQ
jgi:hypothetical protein